MGSARHLAAVLMVIAGLGSIAAKPGSRLGASSPGSKLGEMHLRSGKPQLALQAFKAVLANDPENVAAKLGMGIALATLGECERASEAFDGVRGEKRFRVDGYLAEGRCALEAGDLAVAIERLEEAAAFNLRRPEAVYQLVLAKHLAGDAVGAAAALDELELRQDSEDMVRIARLRLALGTDAYPFERVELEREMARRDRDLSRAMPLVFLEARQDLLDGAPELAKEELLKPARSDLTNQSYALWRAEACRRMGDLSGARFASFRPAIAEARPIPLAFDIRARVLADEGDLDGAQDQVEAHPGRLDPEHVATLWYVARARGEDTAALEALYEVVRRTDSGDLSLLIPRSAP
ncbi:MAG: tetratricopeptide repeat protein [Myxococcota bacterium]